MQFRSCVAAMLMACALPACAVNVNVNDTQLIGSEATDETAIIDVLTRQQAAWNAGDIDAFMQDYWQSPDLRFASGGTVTRGWQETRDRYHTNYSNRALMGELTFSGLEVNMLSDDAAVVHGGWALARGDDNPSGLFTLVFRDMDGGWKIVSDTTTSAD
ncbi:MAG: YybH family protein [Henriciella sp.]